MALNSLFCADVPLSNYSPFTLRPHSTPSRPYRFYGRRINHLGRFLQPPVT